MRSDGTFTPGQNQKVDAKASDRSAGAKQALDRAAGQASAALSPANRDVLKPTRTAPTQSAPVQTPSAQSAPAQPVPVQPAPAPMAATESTASSDSGASSRPASVSAVAEPSSVDTLMARLSPKQIIVLNALFERHSATAAARMADVDPKTVRRWMRTDPNFIAALNARKVENAQMLRFRVSVLADGALENIENAIDAGDVKLSFKLLEKLPIFAPEPPGPVTPEAVEQQLQLEACKVQLQIDREREHAWKRHLRTRRTRQERYSTICPAYSLRNRKINGLQALDLPEGPKPGERADGP